MILSSTIYVHFTYIYWTVKGLDGPLVCKLSFRYRERGLDVGPLMLVLREHLSVEHTYAVHLSPNRITFRHRRTKTGCGVCGRNLGEVPFSGYPDRACLRSGARVR